MIKATLDISNLTPTFDDEFNSFSASPTIGSQAPWMSAYPFGGYTTRTISANHEAEFYSDSTVGVNPFSDSNGVLAISATKAAPGSNSLGLPYDSGVITTFNSFAQTYGYFEVRAELPAGAGLWPAFWLLPADNTGASELDVLETHGAQPNILYTTAINAGIGQQVATTVPNTATGFHTYGLDWEPDNVTYYFDGQQVAQFATPANAHTAMYLLVNLAVGSTQSWGGTTDASTQFPAKFQVDYVRAYATENTVGVTGGSAISAGAAGQPTITGAIAGQATIDQTGATPFSNIHILDDAAQTETVTVALSDASHGSFTNLAGGHYANGVYTFIGSAEDATAALRHLVFLPTAATSQPVTTSFVITARDSSGVAIDSATTISVSHNVLTASGQVIDGRLAPNNATAPLTLQDDGGANAIMGGASGLNVTVNAIGDAIRTQAGSSNTIVLKSAGNTIVSGGRDTITAFPGGQTIDAQGDSVITGAAGASTYTLEGNDALASAGTDTVDILSGNSTVTATGGSITLNQAGGTVHLSELGGGDHETATITGHASVTGGAGLGGLSIDTGSASAQLLLDGGNDTVHALGADFIQAGSGSLTLVGAPDTSTVAGGAGSLLFTNAPAQFNNGTGSTMFAGNNTSTAITGNTGSITVSGVSNTLTVQGPQKLTLTGYFNQVNGSIGTLNVNDQHGFNVINGGPGGLVANVVTGFDNISATGAAAVTLNGAYGDTVTGGAGLLTISDNFGGNNITGGAGGINATINNGYDTLTTASGAIDLIALNVAGDVVHSHGTDTINATGSQTISATGDALINGGTGFSTFALSGNDVLNTIGYDTVSVTAGRSTVNASGQAVLVNQTGGTVQVNASGQTVYLNESGGSDKDTLQVNGNATVTSTAGSGGIAVNTGANVDFVGLGIGANTVTGSGGSLIQVSGGSLTLAGNPSQMTVLGGSGNLTLTGSPATFVEGTGTTTLNATNATQAVTGGAGLVVLAGYNTLLTVSGAQAVQITGYGDTVRGGTGRLAISDSKGFNTLVAGAGGLDLSITAGYDQVTATAAGSVTLDGAYGDTITGGFGLLTVSDNYGGNTVTGGSGGVNATLNALGDLVTTQVGSSNQIVLGGAGNVVHSNGNDLITASAGHQAVVATGNATINGGTGNNIYTLSGAATLSSTGNDFVNVQGGTSTITASGPSILVTQSGDTVQVTETAAGANDNVTLTGRGIVSGGPGRGGLLIQTAANTADNVTLGSGNSYTLSLGADTIQAGSGRDTISVSSNAVVHGGSGFLSLTEGGAGNSFVAGSGTSTVTQGSGASSVQFGAGSTTAYGGVGADLYSFVKGSGGGVDTIFGFRAGTDQLSFSGFSGSAIATEAVKGGSLTLGLVDNTQVTLSGVTQLLHFS